MSQSIDQRIVSMKFDNSQFEREAKTSLDTLDKLKNSLNVDKSSGAFDKLKDSMASLPVATIAQGVEEIQLKFSALGIAAAAVIADLAVSLTHKLGGAIKNTIGLIYSGGLNRALNLEQARFSMNGLLYTTEETVDGVMKQIERYGFGVEDVMKEGGPVQNAVKDTAYGLDEAAKAASNFIASGVTDLKELEGVLKSISGTAAQTGSSYEDIAHIYTRIAGNNRVYAIDLQSFASRGVNAAAALRDYLNKVGETANATEADIRQMVSDGKIDLMTFSKAMYDAFGENAFRANETYTGSLSNLKAALSRLGAKFESKKLENMRDIFNALRPTVDAFSKLLDPLINAMTNLNDKVTKFATGKIDKIKEFFQSFTEDEIRAEKYLKVFDDLSEGLSETQKAIEKAKLEERAITPVEHLADAFNALVSSIKNVALGIKGILSGTLKLTDDFKGLKSIIPLITSFSTKIEEVTTAFKNWGQSGEGYARWVQVILSRAIDAAYNSFDLLKSVLINLSKPLKALLPLFEVFYAAIHTVANNVLTLFNNFARIIRENDLIALSFQKIADVISGVLGPVVEWLWEYIGDSGRPLSLMYLQDVVSSLSEKFEVLVKKAAAFLGGESDYTSIGNSIVSVFEKIRGVLSPVAEGFGKVKDSIVSFFKGLLTNEEGIDIFERIGEIFDKIASNIGKAAEKISEGLNKIKGAFSESFTEFNSTTALTGLTIAGAGGLVYFLYTLIDTIKSGGGIFDKLNQIVDSIKNAVEGLVGIFDSLKNAINVKIVKGISEAILIFVGAMLILSMIEPNRLKSAAKALTIVSAELIGAFAAIAELSNGKRGIAKSSATLISLSVAILILSVAFKSLAKLNYGELERGLTALSSLFLMLVGYVYAIEKISGKNESIVKGSATLIGLAIAIDLLVIAVKKLGEMNWDQLSQGLAAVGGLLIELMVFTKFSEADKMGVSSGAGLILLATALSVLVGVVRKLGEMDYETLEQGLGAIGFALLEVLAFINLLDNSDALKSAAAFLVVAAGLSVMGGALQKIAAIDAMGLANALISMAASLAIITVMLSYLDKDSVFSAIAITLVAGAIVELAYALGILSLIPLEKLFNALLIVGSSLAVVGAAAKLLEPVAGSLIIVSGAIALFGVGLLAAATAMAIATPLLAAFAVGLVGSLEIILNGIITMADQIMLGMAVLLAAILNAIITTAPQIKDAFIVVLQAMLEGFVESFDVIVQTLCDFIIILAETLVKMVPYLFDAGLRLITGILEGIRDNIGEIATIGLEIVTEFLNGIARGLPDLVDSAFNLIITWINSIADAIDKHAEALGEAAWNLAWALITGLVKAIKGFFNEPVKTIKDLGSKMLSGLKNNLTFAKLKEVGKNILKGLTDGLLSIPIVNTIKNVGTSIINGFKSIFGIHSPSTVFNGFGGDILTGLQNGLSEDKGVLNKVSSLGQSLLNKFTEIFNSNKANKAGSDFVSGVGSGMTKEEPNTSKKATNTSAAIGKAFKQGVNNGDFSYLGYEITNTLGTGVRTNQSIPIKKLETLSSLMEGTIDTSEFETIGQNIINGLIKGMDKKASVAVDRGGTIANKIAGQVRKVTMVSSPSRLFMKIGEYCIEGLAIGLSDTTEIDKNLNSIRDTISGVFSGDLNDVSEPTIRPVLDLSEIQNGSSMIGSLLNNAQGISSIVSANIGFSQSQTTILDAINRLSDRINQRLDNELSAEEIYDAIQRGASDANFLVRISGREVTSTVNDINNDAMSSMLGYLGG